MLAYTTIGFIKGGNSMECKEVGKYLVSDPEVYHGELTFKGTRVPVETILHAFKRGYDLDKIAKVYWSK